MCVVHLAMVLLSAAAPAEEDLSALLRTCPRTILLTFVLWRAAFLCAGVHDGYLVGWPLPVGILLNCAEAMLFFGSSSPWKWYRVCVTVQGVANTFAPGMALRYCASERAMVLGVHLVFVHGLCQPSARLYLSRAARLSTLPIKLSELRESDLMAVEGTLTAPALVPISAGVSIAEKPVLDVAAPTLSWSASGLNRAHSWTTSSLSSRAHVRR